MKKANRFKALGIAAAVLAIAFPGVLMASTPAMASTVDGNDLAKTINAQLQSNPVVVIAPAKLSNLDLIKNSDLTEYTTIVAVDAAALKGYAPQDLSDFILSDGYNSGYDAATNILVVHHADSDSIYVSSKKAALKKKIIKLLGGDANSNSVTSQNAGWDILRHSNAIDSAESAYSDYSILWFLLVIPGILAVGLITLGICTVIEGSASARSSKKRHAREARANKRRAKETLKAEKLQEAQAEKAAVQRANHEASVPAELNETLRSLKATSHDVRSSDPELAGAMETMLQRFSELREALSLMGASDVKRGLLYVEYSDRLEKLDTITGERYYKDIKSHPAHWRYADGKLAAIRQSFENTSEQILESIIQLKEGSEFEFAASIDSILGFKITSADEMVNG